MTTINLYQNQEEKNRISAQNLNGGLIFSLVILTITVLTFVGLKFYVPILEAKSAALSASVTSENDKTVGLKKLANIVDVQNRLVEIKNNLQIKNGTVNRVEMNKVLDKLSADLNAGVVVSSYKYNVDTVDVSFESSNFADVAKQILNFKKSDFFTEVNLSSIARKENVVACTVSMKYKKS
ncbi:MAG: PilN domain-containing protein [Candidatus Moranbacteria bacterium]|nr:PilN domain-containing protein [Candidatus Moranbacteria bacterium]